MRLAGTAETDVVFTSADDQVRERVGDLAVSLEVGPHVLLHPEGGVRMPNPLAQTVSAPIIQTRIAAT